MSAPSDVVAQASVRRTFAIISHPDAGKTTLTEKCLLYAGAVQDAGVVRARGAARGATSDFHAMEQERGISIASTVLQFGYRDHTLNLLDTPGHADFSEDTYRVLAAADFAIMVLDAAKGLEPQTLKLFDVCRHRGLPVIGFVNKWDRPGREALELVDEMEQAIGLKAQPLTWPVGMAGEMRGLIDRRDGSYTRFGRAPAGAHRAPEEIVDPERALAEDGDWWTAATEESGLLSEIGGDFDHDDFMAGRSAPMFFGSAMTNAGVRFLLDAAVDLAPSPAAQPTEKGEIIPVDAPFAAKVFKVAGSTNKQHRDRTAYLRVCSGRFERGMVVTQARSGRTLSTKYAHTAFAADRQTVEDAYPGDVVGLVNAGDLRAGDTLYVGDEVTFPPMPTFAPEYFQVATARDHGRYKQFRTGIGQLDDEGVVQVLRNDRRGDQSPVLGAVGPMQFEVAVRRMADEYGVEMQLSSLPYTVARTTDEASLPALDKMFGLEVFRRSDGTLLALIDTPWRLRTIRSDHPEVVLGDLMGSVEPERYGR